MHVQRPGWGVAVCCSRSGVESHQKVLLLGKAVNLGCRALQTYLTPACSTHGTMQVSAHRLQSAQPPTVTCVVCLILVPSALPCSTDQPCQHLTGWLLVQAATHRGSGPFMCFKLTLRNAHRCILSRVSPVTMVHSGTAWT